VNVGVPLLIKTLWGVCQLNYSPHQEVTGCLCRPRAVEVRGHAGQVDAAGTILDDDQGVKAPQQHGVHMDEIGRKDPGGPARSGNFPGWARATRCWVDPGGVRDLPYRGGSDRVAEIEELALHAPMAPRWVVRCDADHELADHGCRGRPSGTPPVRVVPFAVTSRRFQASRVAGVTANTLVPPAPGDRPGDCGEPQPAGRLVADQPGRGRAGSAGNVVRCAGCGEFAPLAGIGPAEGQ
jgi:hypothetical protein